MNMGPDSRAISQALPNYDIGPELGRGGYGVVYAGRHRQLGRPVAIKQLSGSLASDAQMHARFIAEARVLASLEHPHIVPVYDYVEHEGICLLVMESLNGGTVWNLFRQTGVTSEQACAIAIITATALHHAHSRGVLHRDVKPENLLLSSAQHLKLADFGIAKVVGGSDALVTSAGEILGTPAYMAPEQAKGADLGPATGVYATGVMLYELLSGRLPYSDDGGGIAIVYRHVYDVPEPISEAFPHVPRPVAEVVMRALARSPDERFSSAEEFGIAVGEAACRSFGVDWAARAGLSIFAGDRIQTTLEAQSSRQPVTAGGLPVPAVSAKPTVIRPSTSAHLIGAAPFSASDEPFVPVREVLNIPPPPTREMLAALALGVLLLLLAFFGVGAGSKAGSIPGGDLTVAGTSLTQQNAVRLNLGSPISVRVSGIAGAGQARMVLSVPGLRLASSNPTSLSPDAGGVAGTLMLSSALSSPRYLVPGPVTATLFLANDEGASLGIRTFTALPTGTGFATLPGVVVVVLVLFLAAYLESLFRPLRRFGRWKTSRGVGIALLGAVAGATLVGLAWVTGFREPSVLNLTICALVGMVESLAIAKVLTRNGLRGRARRVAEKYVHLLALGQFPQFRP